MTAAELRAIGLSCAPGTSGRYIEAGCALEVTYRGGHVVVLVRGNDDSGAARWMPRAAGSPARTRPSCTDLVLAAEAATVTANRPLSTRRGRVIVRGA
jgi:hypothetical protein